jgi:IBR domain, a half RING-finger domain
VEGDTEEVLKTKLCLSKLQTDHTAASHVDLCPVCFCIPEQVPDVSVVRLVCKHSYCHECFESWPQGTHTYSFPLVCLTENCSFPVTLADLGSNLGCDGLSVLLRVAVDYHVRKNTPRLKFCPTPTCSGIHDSMMGSTSSCSTCLSLICNECNAAHEGIGCTIVDDILTLHCPRCHQANSVCPCKFCGWRLADCEDHDVHPHVKTCTAKEHGADTYFGSKEQFEAIQRKKRIIKLKPFLQLPPQAKRAFTLASLEKDLADLGLHTRLFQIP